MRASVVVPLFNARATIGDCLASLDRQTLAPEDYEVIVVDDGSTDDTASLVRAFAEGARARFRLVELPSNRGPAAARNAGVAEVSAPVVAFTDADCIAAADWLERGLARLEQDREAAGVEGRTDPAGGEVSATTHQMRNPGGGLWMTCNMLYRRAAIERAGGFDERFRLAWLEDSDLAFAVLSTGATIAWDPSVVVRHQVLEVGRRRFVREARKRFYNPLLFRKHPALYREHLSSFLPAIPGLHVRYMAATLAPFAAWAVGWPGLAAILGLVWAWLLRRVLFAYKARDAATAVQAAVHPFVQTFWTLAGAVKFRTFSVDL